MFQIRHYITGPPQREEIFFREIKNETVIKFYFRSMPQLKFLRTFFISFVVFGAAVLYRPSSMVDYTEREKKD